MASDAVLCCYRRIIQHHEKDGVELDSGKAIVTMDDFKEAMKNCTPSVTETELKRYKQIRDEISNRL